MYVDKLPLELIGIQTLDVATVILEEVCELVVEEDGGVEVCNQLELNNALAFRSDVCDGAVVDVIDKGVSGGSGFGVLCAQTVREPVCGHVNEIGGVVGRRCS